MSLALLLALPLIAAAPETAPVCAATPAAPPAGLEAWSSGSKVTASTDAVLPLGRRVDARLLPVARIAFAAPPAKAPAAGTLGGMVRFTVVTAGSYRVALGTAAWIDVLRDGKAIAATAHDHGPACSGIRKIVDFALTPARYVLQISGSKDATAAILVTPRP